MIPVWLLTAFAGLAIGMGYAWWEKRNTKKKPLIAKRLTHAAVGEITDLLASGKQVRAIKLLRMNTGLSLLDAKNRVDDWRPDEEYEAAS